MGYGLVPAITFYELFEAHRMALFDLNVRYYLERSSVNRQIIKTLSEVKGQKMFHLLNNGITVSCDGWKIPNVKDGDSPYMKLFNPQIINGCQTVISIYRAYLQIEDEYKQRSLQTDCLVPVRIIRTNKREVLDDVVTASNNQNKMTARNLKSNSPVQRVLQRKFDELEHAWFYERKEGEFASLKEYPSRTMKPKNYQNAKTVRLVRNDVNRKDVAFFHRDVERGLRRD
jgi:AIPR protein